MLAWDVRQGISAISQPVKPTRFLENLEAANIKLNDTELQKIDALDQNIRLVNEDFWVMEGAGAKGGINAPSNRSHPNRSAFSADRGIT